MRLRGSEWAHLIQEVAAAGPGALKEGAQHLGVYISEVTPILGYSK